jgi:hypothetical protein
MHFLWSFPGLAAYCILVSTHEQPKPEVDLIVAPLEIVACFGSDMTEDALNHRFRRLRAEAVIIAEARKEGYDMKDLKLDGLPAAQNKIDKKGTPDLQFLSFLVRVCQLISGPYCLAWGNKSLTCS